MQPLYPVTFLPILKSIIWGGDKITSFKNILPAQNNIGESWEISQVKTDISVVECGALAGCSLTDLITTYREQLMGKKVIDCYGDKFPLLIKFIDAKDNLSIQVHPNDALAATRHNSYGKTEMWYVIDAEEGAGLYSGFAQQITPAEYEERVANHTIVDVLAFHPVKAGDIFFLPAGRIHAICKGIFVAEIQQTSDITYRIYDYNRIDAAGNQRELHTQLAKDAIDYTLYPDLKSSYLPLKNSPVPLASCKYFTTNLLQITASITRPIAINDSFFIYICTQGEATLTDSNGYTITLKQGVTTLIAACIENIVIAPLTPTCTLIECYI